MLKETFHRLRKFSPLKRGGLPFSFFRVTVDCAKNMTLLGYCQNAIGSSYHVY